MRVRLEHFLDLFGEYSWRNVYAGQRKCAHQVRPPLSRLGDQRCLAVAKPLATFGDLSFADGYSLFRNP